MAAHRRLGSLHENGFLSITGRTDIIITSGGKNITPDNLENDLKQSPFISHAVTHATPPRYPVTLMTLDPPRRSSRRPASAGSRTTPATSRNTPTSKPRCRTWSTPRNSPTRGSTNSRYAQLEQLKSFAILDHELTRETDELAGRLVDEDLFAACGGERVVLHFGVLVAR